MNSQWGRLWATIAVYDTREEAQKARDKQSGECRIHPHKGKWLLKKPASELIKGANNAKTTQDK